MTTDTSPFNQDRASAKWVVVVALLTLINGLFLVVDGPKKPKGTPCPFASTVLCAELPPNGAELQAVLSAPVNTPDQWKWQVLWDFPFLVFYGLLLAMGGWFRSRTSPHQWLRKTMVALIAVGAFMDVVENIGILTALSDVTSGTVVTDGLATLTRVSSQMKFSLLCFGGAIACGFFLLDKSGARRGRFQATFAICLCGLILVWPFDIRFIEYGFIGIIFACLILFVYAVAHLWFTRHGEPAASDAATEKAS